jgi:lipoprotein-anchoring transpeptidase ErfK/SrfK
MCLSFVSRRKAMLLLATLGYLLASGIQAFSATLVIVIDLSEQEMTVLEGSMVQYKWAVSTARSGYCTPVGTYQPVRMERMWYSTVYDNAPMPFSIFFHRGYAIHGTDDTNNLGRPASHGCVRLHPDHARTLFELVLRHGRTNTMIRIQA